MMISDWLSIVQALPRPSLGFDLANALANYQ
jgi:hypothetical protein